MTLDDLCARIDRLLLPNTGEQAQPDFATVRVIREAVGEAIADDDFLADCLWHELRLIEEDQPRSGLVPFYVMPDTGVRFALGYWGPGATPGPHEHTAWTVTAVCRNELDVYTFDRDASYRRRELVPKNRFQASAGKVGHIFDPCIHAPINTSSAWTLSLHVTSPRDGEPLGDYEGIIPGLARPFAAPRTNRDHPYAQVMSRRRRDRYLGVVTRIAAEMTVRRATRLLQACHRMGSTQVRRLACELRPGEGFESETRWRLERTHPDIEMSWRALGDRIVLEAQTNHGARQELVVDAVARSAIAFAVETRHFHVHDLPGVLTLAERRELGAALEETGLFRRIV